MTPGQIDRVVADHGEQMARFGYLPDWVDSGVLDGSDRPR
jgi:hypothetical protein